MSHSIPKRIEYYNKEIKKIEKEIEILQTLYKIDPLIKIDLEKKPILELKHTNAVKIEDNSLCGSVKILCFLHIKGHWFETGTHVWWVYDHWKEEWKRGHDQLTQLIGLEKADKIIEYCEAAYFTKQRNDEQLRKRCEVTLL